MTRRRTDEREKADLLKQTEELLRQKHVLLQEMEHRVANSLQIIASILMLKARAVNSEETSSSAGRPSARDVGCLRSSSTCTPPTVSTRLRSDPTCRSFAAAWRHQWSEKASPSSSKWWRTRGDQIGKAVSIGLIVTELPINAIKYAFPINTAGALVLVTYEIEGSDWKLTVSDNGVGKAHRRRSQDWRAVWERLSSMLSPSSLMPRPRW